jgi:hypothetical protein
MTVDAARTETVRLADRGGKTIEREVPCAAGTTLGAIGVALTLRLGDLCGGAGCSSCSVIPLLDPVEHGALFVGERSPRFDGVSFETVTDSPDSIRCGSPACLVRPWSGVLFEPRPFLRIQPRHFCSALTIGERPTNGTPHGPVAIAVDVQRCARLRWKVAHFGLCSSASRRMNRRFPWEPTRPSTPARPLVGVAFAPQLPQSG